jgi:hypothetical protein
MSAVKVLPKDAGKLSLFLALFREVIAYRVEAGVSPLQTPETVSNQATSRAVEKGWLTSRPSRFFFFWESASSKRTELEYLSAA